MEKKPQRRSQSAPVMNNKILLMLIGILSAVLVVLLVIVGSLPDGNVGNPTDSLMNSNGSTASSDSVATLPSHSEVTQPSSSVVTEPTTIPTQPPTKPPAPTGGEYVQIQGGYIAEVIQATVETFDGNTRDDFSHPTNNYLPEGTVDYCSKDLIYYGSMKYVQLRSGHRVYYDKKVYPHPEEPYARMVKEVKQYEGWLPDHNEIGVSSLEIVGHHTVLTLDTVWKAPFHFGINQTGYANPNGGSGRDYAIAGNNITYLDITFCYATVFDGNVTIPADHPLFKSAQIIKNESDYTLRLHLRKAGGFYGWKAYYNDQDQLCFQFLNPTKVSAADNKYGADLTGVTVMIDVGHGGVDGGATGKNAEGQKWDEAECNLSLAYALKAELESIGATVVMNRYGDDRIDVNTRQEGLLDASPDICIAIHQNANDSAKVKGFDSFYFTPWSHLLAKKVCEYTKSSGAYTKASLKWGANYFMTRQAVCPSILTENGFMSNQDDLKGMVDPEIVKIKAEAMTHGVADYFLIINR